MAEHAERTGGGLREGLGDGMRQIRDDMSRDNLEKRLDEAVNERPLMRHLLDLGVVVRALLIAAVLTLVVALLFSPQLGAIVLVLSFGALWYGLANRHYNQRRPTKPVDAAGDDDR